MDRITLTGTIDGIIYCNDENGYTVCEVDSESDGQFCAVGYMPAVTEGEIAELTGEWVMHPGYGEQFKVELCRTVMPSDESSVVKYLSSGIIKGVREATAKKLYEAFGNDIFDVMANEPHRLSEIKGISVSKAETISKSFSEQRAVQNIVMFLQQYNIPPKTAIRIHRIFGDDAIAQIKKNPYSLADSVEGISFKTSDMIAAGMGFPKNSPMRIRSGVIYYLTDASYTGGHVYMPRRLLTEHVVYELGISENEAENAISELAAERTIRLDETGGETACYLSGLYYDEQYIAGRVRMMASAPARYGTDTVTAEREIAELEEKKGIELAPEQRDAVITALSGGGCMILTGGPGTGKTTTINVILELLDELKLNVELAAPTGRAAKRMTSITGREARTIHRLLGAQPKGETSMFVRDEDAPLTADVVILDEVSMVDTALMASFLRAVKPGGRVILCGDSDQLPSVGAGNVLHDLIDSGAVPVIRLTRIFRQSEESLIITNAHRINRGEMPELCDHTRDFFFMRRKTAESAVETILDLYAKRLPESYGIDPLGDIQVLTPMKKGVTGTAELNRMLQSRINPGGRGKLEHAYGKGVFREGDKVMQTRNDYDMPYTASDGSEGLGIYNGDIGVINSIHEDDKYMIITFDEKTVLYPFMNLDELVLAYAITVHKSQGSEFPFVIMPVCAYIPMLMSRNLFYTAVTRAKKMVILVGSERTVANMTANNSYTKRFTGLCEKICRAEKISAAEGGAQ